MDIIKVALADDHSLFRKGLIPMINAMDGIEVVVDVANGKELLDALEDQPVDVVLLDLIMPEMDGKAATIEMTEQYPDIPIIILSSQDEERMILNMVELGAKGYMLKDAEPEEVEMAIRAVMENGFYFNDRISKLVLKGMVEKNKLKSRFNTDITLSKRELEILELTCLEYTGNEIADQLCISQRTVEGHRYKMLEKIGARNVVGLAVYAFQNDLVKLPQ